MSLATRCTACGTVFRIVEDQLRVSDGWVRCGRCAEIFDAREMLFDIEREAPPPWPQQFVPEPVMEPPPPPPPPPPPEPEPEPEPVWMPPPPLEPRGEPLPTGWPGDELRQEPRWVDDERPAPASPAPIRIDPPEPALPPPSAPVVEPADAPPMPVVPEFMRHAEKTARWNRPAVRALLGAAALLLSLALLLQVTLHFRDALAALHPPLRGPLQALCSAFGCEVQPWRRIEALKIDSTTLTPVGTGNSYKLALTLTNRANVAVAAPSIELRLTNGSGAPLARRVFGPESLTPQLQQVPALSEQMLTLTFRTPGQTVSGYVVEAFYP